MKVLFLYSELAGYFISCLEALLKRGGVEIHVVHLPVNSEAPFDFTFSKEIKCYQRRELSRNDLISLSEKIAPNMIYCSGWMDADYLKVCERFRNKIPVVLGFDNKWTGTFKQRIGSLFSRNFIHRYFTHCWIPGNPQLEYAHRMHFEDENILNGFYSCDYDRFHGEYLKNIDSKRSKFPHRFIFTGRYYDFKGIRNLWDAFAAWQRESSNDWELWCLGTGDIKPVDHPKIKHFGFVQPNEIGKFIAGAGVFVLPSHFEPWGVAVHEFASAGFPLICSDEVGAADLFLKEGENGLSFKAESVSQLKSVFKKIVSFSDEQLFAMGERSAELASQITPKVWAETLMSVKSKL